MPIPLAMPFPPQVKQLLNHFLDSLGSIRLLSCSSIQDISSCWPEMENPSFRFLLAATSAVHRISNRVCAALR